LTRLAVFNQKGGVGKTTTTLNLAAALATRGLHPAVLDLDAQAHLSGILSPADRSEDSVFAFYSDGRPLAALVRRVPLGQREDGAGEAELVPAHAELMKVDSLFGKGPRILYKLKEGIDALLAGEPGRPLFVDCCPMLGVLSLSGVFAADKVLVPISTDFLAVKGALQLEGTLKALEHVLKKRVERRYLLTRFDTRRRMAHDIEADLRERFGAELCQTRIAESVALAESPYHHRDIFAHDGRSRGARDYAALAEELLATGFLEV
jgi:chromosome partitioning protein